MTKTSLVVTQNIWICTVGAPVQDSLNCELHDCQDKHAWFKRMTIHTCTNLPLIYTHLDIS